MREAVAEGADLVTFSGDKLLGGPQAGFIVGRADLIARDQPQPDEAGAAGRQDPAGGAGGDAAAVPRPRPAGRTPADPAPAGPQGRRRSRPRPAASCPRWTQALAGRATVEVRACASQIGSGALPLETLPSAALALTPPGDSGRALNALAAALRGLPVPVVGRIADGALLLDLRCLEDEAGFLASLAALAPGGSDELA